MGFLIVLEVELMLRPMSSAPFFKWRHALGSRSVVFVSAPVLLAIDV